MYLWVWGEFYIFLLWVSVCICAGGCYTYMCMQRLAVDIWLPCSIVFHLMFFRQGPSLNSLIWLSRLVRVIQGVPYLYLTSTMFRDMHPHNKLFMCVLGFELKSPRLSSDHSIRWVTCYIFTVHVSCMYCEHIYLILCFLLPMYLWFFKIILERKILLSFFSVLLGAHIVKESKTEIIWLDSDRSLEPSTGSSHMTSLPATPQEQCSKIRQEVNENGTMCLGL